MRKPTRALLFNPIAREAVTIIYDRADQRRFRDVLGESVIQTPIEIQSIVRWFVYSGETSAEPLGIGIGMRVQGEQTEMLFAGVAILVGNRGQFERDVDFDLLWPTFEFRWIGEGEHTPFKLGPAYTGDRRRQPGMERAILKSRL